MDMHPNHVHFATRMGLDKREHLIGVLDAMEPEARDELFRFAFIWSGATRRPESEEDILSTRRVRGSLFISEVYSRFRAWCLELDAGVDYLLAHGVVAYTLSSAFHFGDPDRLPDAVAATEETLRRLRGQLSAESRRGNRERLLREIEENEEHLRSLPEKIQHMLRLYTDFCEGGLARLIELRRG